MYHFELGFYSCGYKYNLIRLGELRPNDLVLEYWINNDGIFNKRRTFKIERIEQRANKVAVIQYTTAFNNWEKIQFFIPIDIDGLVRRVGERIPTVKYFAYRWDGSENIFKRYDYGKGY